MIVAIIQARLGSSRLPGKTLMDIHGRPMLGHLLSRVQSSTFIQEIVIATTDQTEDDAIVDFAKKNRIKYYRGSEVDVLDRLYRAAVMSSAGQIVRVTPDCPMLDPNVTDKVIRSFLAGNFDYASNAIQPTYPDGLDTEIFEFSALKTAWKEAVLPSEREHVTAYIVKNPERFRLLNVTHDGEDLSWMRWTVDTEDDLRFIRKIFSYIPEPDKIFHMQDVIDILRKHPELLKINSGILRNEGYRLSLQKDRTHESDDRRH